MKKFKVGMKVSIGPIGEPQSITAELIGWNGESFLYKNLVSGLSGSVSDQLLRSVGVVMEPETSDRMREYGNLVGGLAIQNPPDN